MNRLHRIAAAAAVTAAVAAGAGFQRLAPAGPKVLQLQGTVVVPEVRLGSKLGGRVAEVNATEGETVHPGQPLVRFETRDLEEERGRLQEDIQAAEARLKKAKDAADLAAALGAGKVAPGSLAEAEYRLAEARTKLREVEARLRESVVRAPGPVVVEVIGVRRGDLVPPFQPVVRALRPEEVWVQAYVPADELARLRPNQAVEVVLGAFPTQRFRGTVAQIAGVGEFTPRNVQSPDERRHQVFGVKVRVDNPQGVFKSGMTADILIPLPKGQESHR